MSLALGTAEPRRLSFFAIATLALAALGAFETHAQVQAQILEGDRAWALRADVLADRLAESERIDSAIRHYREAANAAPLSLEARWKLLRALHYSVEFTRGLEEEKDTRVADAIELARSSIAILREQGGAERDRARVLFWSAIAWGTRAQRVGLLTLVREGAATRMHDYAEESLVLDETVDRGGALRLLSRLHATLPRVPFISGWVDRSKALPLAERGYGLDPDHPGNRLVLALALIDRAPGRQAEARALLESIQNGKPRPEMLVEDTRIREEALEQLEALNRAAR